MSERRSYHLRLGFVRLLRYYWMDFPFTVIRMHEGMRRIFGWEIQYRQFGLQVAWYWWGFGRDGGSHD